MGLMGLVVMFSKPVGELETVVAVLFGPYEEV